MHIQVKRLLALTFLFSISLFSFAQQTKDKRSDRRERISTMVKQEEEGVLSYTKQNAFGIELRTNGYGVFYEHGKRRTQKATTIYGIELTEIKDRKEDKRGGNNFFANSYVYGKINNFYQVKLGLGQQYIFGQKGNKNGVAVLGSFQGGLALGLLKPYYVDIVDGVGQNKPIKFEDDSARFLGPVNGASGFTVGWGELKLKPGVFLKTALRFDFGAYNESIQALEIGMSADFYSDKIPMLVYNDPKQFFFQGHIAFVFGRRK